MHEDNVAMVKFNNEFLQWVDQRILELANTQVIWRGRLEKVDELPPILVCNLLMKDIRQWKKAFREAQKDEAEG